MVEWLAQRTLYPLQILVTVSFHSSLFFAIVLMSVQLKPIASCSLFTLLSVEWFVPFPFSYLVLVLQCCHLPFLMYIQSNSICFVLLVPALFCSTIIVAYSGQCIFSIFLNNLFMKLCNFCVISLSTFQVKAAHSNTVLIVQLNILTFISAETTFVLHMPPSWLNACCALLILVSTSALLPPFLSITAPK
jgi:hypothetical protein